MMSGFMNFRNSVLGFVQIQIGETVFTQFNDIIRR